MRQWSNGPRTGKRHDQASRRHRERRGVGGAFWGLLLGLIFFVHLGARSPISVIDDNFIRQTREKVTKGTSALFLLSTGAVTDRVVPEMKHFSPELIATNLSTEQEGRLRELFAEKQNVS